jgi:RimJ/RimL family protein N-acetyltransferase
MRPFALQTARLLLDSPVESDRARLVEYCQDPAFERFLTLPWPYTEKDADVFLGELVPTWWDTDTEYTWALRWRDGAGATATEAATETATAPTTGTGTATATATATATESAHANAARDLAGTDFLGVIGFRLKSRSIGFWLGAEHRGIGLMPEAFAAVARWAFNSGFPKIVWECVVGNLASASVARGAGFTFGGEKESAMAYRDGSHPASWHGTLVPHNLGVPQDGWPPETFATDATRTVS